MAKALSSATTPLIILTLTIITSTILYSTYTQTFGSITFSPETVYKLEILQTVNGSLSQLILYNPNPVPIKITETVLGNTSAPFSLKYANMSICKENTIPPNSIAILEIKKPIDVQKTIYLKSDNKIIAYYTKGP
ncbi:MAG: hypothetical protein N3F64_00595 [Nitrososphaeria archaeon]|nr:hypothetical protein [Nitrososphaeria archaeon]